MIYLLNALDRILTPTLSASLVLASYLLIFNIIASNNVTSLLITSPAINYES